MKTHTLYLLLLPLLILFSCQTDYTALPTYSANKQLQAVIETPAGNTLRLVYDQEKKEFLPDLNAGHERQVNFLPYPGNLGFIPSTEIDKDGKGLEVLVLAERKEPGTEMEVIPVGLMQLENRGELRHIVVAVPARPSERQLDATNYESFSKNYPGAKAILQIWFSNYNESANTRFVGWRDEKFAEKEIQRWMKL
ncbi:inorganic diphosphatase [Pontibacter anaerobius]|uniref:inorganic diphosphatase n=1 Tax=Pontibacter anaerobius TaxID=2993940 RepID=A0ABT3RB12_9BACT|nr:inorganic diphosphatase [Pontibacter anaerobius]MCX2738687.1 inorganic diphosphatase [Pontibacter anaerobius]